MRLAIYSDLSYRRDGDAVWAELPVVTFLAGLASWMERVTLVGRLEEASGRWATQLPDDVAFAPLPHYSRLTHPGQVLGSMAISVRRFWRVLDHVDGVWLLGPHPFALVFVLLARLRGRRVALGVRQDLPAYVANRHPGQRRFKLIALALEGAWRLVGRTAPVVVVGSDLARRYSRAKRLLTISISLIREAEIAEARALDERDYSGELRVLSVGRLDAEKNPLLLADVLAELVRRGGRWRLLVCGDGQLEEELAKRLAELGVAEHAELLGFVAPDEGLDELYRSSHMMLHCSWTEGVPQVLLEAFAARLPVAATAVGGTEEAAGDAALLMGPGDAQAAADLLERLATDAALRSRLTESGARRARHDSLEAGTRRLAEFLTGVAVDPR